MSILWSSKLIFLVLSTLLSGSHSSFLPEGDGENHPILRSAINVQPIASDLIILNRDDPFPDSQSAAKPLLQAPTQKEFLPNLEFDKKSEPIMETTDSDKSITSDLEHAMEPAIAILELTGKSNMPQTNPSTLSTATTDEAKNVGDKVSLTFINEFEKPNVPAVKQETVNEREISDSKKVVEATLTATHPTTEQVVTAPGTEQIEDKKDPFMKPSLDNDFFLPVFPPSKPYHKKHKSKCEGVKCTLPDFPEVCEITKIDMTAKAEFTYGYLTDCCPVWFCSRPDGTVYTHYGLTRIPKRRSFKAGSRNKLRKNSNFHTWGPQQEIFEEDYYDGPLPLPPVMSQLAPLEPAIARERVHDHDFSRSSYQKPYRPYSKYRSSYPKREAIHSFPNAPRRTFPPPASQYPGNRFAHQNIPLPRRNNPFVRPKTPSPSDIPLDILFNLNPPPTFKQRKPEIPFLPTNVDLLHDKSDSGVILDYPAASHVQEKKQKLHHKERTSLKLQTKLIESLLADLDDANQESPVSSIIIIESQPKPTQEVKAQSKVESEDTSPLIIMAFPDSDPVLQEKPAAKEDEKQLSENAIEEIQERAARRARYAPLYGPPIPFPYMF
ncbi:unnamed protein product [Allacma fusca]|uniref:Uncharacterized protein n=1 Tax=Allacma fusca TaxID=39272 RepID=A0A8J2MDT2_9HEXA|nr:unnamed protein product [Allacma fusca]